MNIGIVGARKYKDKSPVVELVNSLPADSVIVTSGCAGVCTWVREEAEKRNMEVVVYSPDLQNIRAWFEVAKRYYQRNKELVEACDFLYAFVSQEDGFAGGTRFEVKYALKLKKPVQLHWENGISETFYQYPLPFIEPQHTFFFAWQEFFCKTNLEMRGE